MDQGTLVEAQIAHAQRLIDRLVEEDVAMTAAGWLKESESGQWFLYLVTPLVGGDGPKRPAYRRVNTVIRQMLSDLSRRYTGPSPIRYGSAQFKGLGIEEAYVYPPITAPVG
jgi:hypothetical protein